jgi:hypothetical protein
VIVPFLDVAVTVTLGAKMAQVHAAASKRSSMAGVTTWTFRRAGLFPVSFKYGESIARMWVCPMNTSAITGADAVVSVID